LESSSCVEQAASWKRTLYIAFLAQFVASTGFSSTFPFLPLYVKELGSDTFLGTDFLAGAVYSAQGLAMMVASPFWGNLADKYGRKLMVERAMFGGAIIITLMGFVRNAEELVVLKAIQGAITGVISANAALVAAAVPRERTGYAMGLMQVAMGSGISLGPLLGGLVADQWGYYMAFWVTGGSLLLAGLVVLFGVNENFTPRMTKDTNTESVVAAWRKLLKTPGVAITYLMSFSCRLGRTMMMPLLPFLAQAILADMSRLNSFTGLVLGISAVTMTLSASYTGRLGDRIGHRIVLSWSLFFSSVLFGLHALATSGWHLLALAALMGLALGGMNPSVSALLARYSQSGQEGKVYGLDNSVMSSALMIGPMLAASLAPWVGVSSTFFVVGFIALCSGLVSYRFLPGGKRSNKASQAQ
jgi:DHA1 family multidrug resistance protein-like MFS transporter